MKFPRTDKDILLGNPRYIELIDKSRIFFHALSILELKVFLPRFLELFNFEKDKLILKGLIDCKADLANIREYLINNLSFDYHGENLIIKGDDVISLYNGLMKRRKNDNFQVERIIPLDPWDALITIIEQNQFIELFDLIIQSDSDFQRETYTSSFNILEIMNLNLIDGLTLINWEEKLTNEQRNFYSDLVEQKRKKELENSCTALSIAIGNAIGGAKINLKEVLFPMSEEEAKKETEWKELKLLEDRRKSYMKETYTGIKAVDDALLLEIIRNNPQVSAYRFFKASEIEKLDL